MTTRSNPPTVVIIGAGFAGVACARRLGDHGVAVTLVDRHNYNQFQPLLYQVVTAQVGVDERGPTVARDLPAPPVAVKLATVNAVDPTAKTVTCLDGTTFPADHLVLAAGSDPTSSTRRAPTSTPSRSTPSPTPSACASRIFEVFEDADRDPALIARAR